MVEADAIVLKEVNLEFIIALIALVFMPDAHGFFQDLIFLREVPGSDTIKNYHQVDAILVSKESKLRLDISFSMINVEQTSLSEISL